jgi:hypothetical protein
MTFRAVLIGLAAALSIAGLGYLNDQILQLESVLGGHQLPISVIGVLILAMLLANPLLFRVNSRWALRPAEVAVATGLTLVACSIPLRGLMEFFPSSLVSGVHWNINTTGWRKNNLLQYVPATMMMRDQAVIDAMISGLRQSGRDVGLGAVAWGRWAPVLTTWLPLVLCMSASSICLGLIVHRQWSRHERLRYPIPEFTASLIERPEGAAFSTIFRNRLFWLGLGAVLAIRVINGLYLWYPDRLLEIPLTQDFTALSEKFKVLQEVPWGPSLSRPTIYPLAIGFSFFLASEVSLSLGLTQLLVIPVTAYLMSRGVDIQSDLMAGGLSAWQRFGSYLAYALLLAYTGRHWYGAVIRHGLTFRPSGESEPYAAWALRVLLLALAGMVVMAALLGLPWTLAILTFPLMLVLFVGVSRIAAETGLFFIQPRWQPLGVLLGFFGGYALGPRGMIVAGLLCVVLSMDPSQSLMPYWVNALRLNELLGVRPKRLAGPAVGTYLAALALGLVVVLWAQFNFGLPRTEKASWNFNVVPKLPFESPNQEIDAMVNNAQLQASVALSPLERLTSFQPDRRFLRAAGIGIALVLVFGILRLRLSWWPIHPVMFMVWDTAPMAGLSFSFLLGWMVKTAVTRLGGFRPYQRLKPLMVGVIAGDVLGGLVWIVVGVAYYAVTGLMPINMRFLPK